MEQLVYYHHVFLWYYLAGVVATIFFYYLARYTRRVFTGKANGDDITVLSILLLILTGSSTHLIIKFRPYLSVPLLTYKCTVAILGVSILISYVLMNLNPEQVRNRRAIIFVWCLILFGGLTRNTRLAHIALDVMPGTRYTIIPDPLAPILTPRTHDSPE
jgi:hypothetical protein